MLKNINNQNTKKNNNTNNKPRSANKNRMPGNSKMVSAPVAKALVQKIDKPTFAMNKGSDGRVLVRHKEYMGDVNGSINFASITYPLNPGLPITFPWLNTITVAYESYKFKRLRFWYESSKSTATNGAVVLAVDFDPTDAAPTTKAQVLAYNNAVRGPSWESFCYTCSAQDLAKFNQKFLRFGNLVSGQDALLYDVGNLFVCTSGFADTTIIGELHVEYEVELITPQLDLNAYALSTAAKLVAVGTISTSAILGSSVTATGGVSVTYTGLTGLNILIPGQYLLSYTVDGTALAQAFVPALASTGNSIALISTTVSATRITIIFTAQIDVTSSIITASSFWSAGTPTSAVMRISYYAAQLA